MLKVNNKGTRTTPDVVLVSLLLTLNIFHISIALVSLLLTLDMQLPAGYVMEEIDLNKNAENH